MFSITCIVCICVFFFSFDTCNNLFVSSSVVVVVVAVAIATYIEYFSFVDFYFRVF